MAEQSTEEWLGELREICDWSMDAEQIRRKLHKRVVPASLRGAIWQVLMRVKGKPDALASTDITTAEHDCPLKEDCRALATRVRSPAGAGEDEVPSEESVANEMELVLTHYVRARGLEYDSLYGWAEILTPFMSVAMTRGDRYNCFYAVMSKYCLKDTTPDSASFEVFRILLMYHDAELCALLDTLRVGPKDFAQTWIRIMLINGKEYVFELAKSPDTLVQELTNMPTGLSADDVGDMCDLARHFSSVTPTSFRADFNSRLFNSGGGRRAGGRSADAASVMQTALYEKLSLCVSVDTVLRHTEGAIKFFVIDIRPIAQYDAGHLPYAWHLDATLMLDNPEIFSDEVAQLEDALQASLQHPTFLGSGRPEEDNSLSMIVSHFLQRKHQYVSIVKGGFKALHAKLEFEGRTASSLTGHSPSRLLAAIDPNAPPPAAAAEASGSEKKKFSLGWGKKSAGSSSKEKKKDGNKSSALSSMSSMWSKAKASTESIKAKARKKPAAADANGDDNDDDNDDDNADGGGGGGGGGDDGEGEKGEKKSTSVWGAKMKGWGNAFKESLREAAIATGNAADALVEDSATGLKKLKERTKEGIEQVRDEARGAIEKRKKKDGMYRGNERPMFSIDDDDDEDPDHHASGKGGGADLDLAGAVLRRSAAGEIFVSVSKAKKQAAIVHYFQCSEVGAEGYLFPSHLLLTQTHLIKLRDRNGKRGEAVVLSRRELSRIQRITAKKRHPNILTFVFDAEQHPSSLPPSPSAAAGESHDGAHEAAVPGRQQEAADAAGEGSDGKLKEDVLNASIMQVDIGSGEGAAAAAATDPAPLISFAPALDDGEEDGNDAASADAATAGGGADADAAAVEVGAESTADAAEGGAVRSSEGGAAEPSEPADDSTDDAAEKDAAAALATAAAAAATEPPQVTQVVERFMIPEASVAKEAFRTLIVAGRGA